LPDLSSYLILKYRLSLKDRRFFYADFSTIALKMQIDGIQFQPQLYGRTDSGVSPVKENAYNSNYT
jgi:hypothetical protein